MVSASPRRHNERKPAKRRKAPKPSKRAARSSRISASMRVTDILSLCPDAERVLADYGIHCAGCSIGGVETLEEGCRIHGLERDDIHGLVEDLNILLHGLPARPRALTVTAAAARAIKKVMKAEGRMKENLLVTADGSGGFCLEFQKETPPDTSAFTHPDEPGVRILASSLTLRRLGGSTIDYREERFKLDLPDDCAGNGSCGEECGCGGKKRGHR